MEGRFEIRAERRGARTHLARAFAQAPLKLAPVVTAEDGTACVVILNPTGGLASGDAWRTDVHVAGAARLLLSDQAATKVYRSDDGTASIVEQRFRVLDGGVLDVLTEPVIPFAGSAYEGSATFDLAPQAALFLREVVSAGRLARGERFMFRRYRQRTDVRRGGRFLHRERIDLAGPSLHSSGWSHDPLALGLWEEYAYLGTLFIMHPDAGDALARTLDDLVSTTIPRAGASRVAPGAVLVRALSSDLPALSRVLDAAWRLAREVLLHAPAPDFRERLGLTDAWDDRI